MVQCDICKKTSDTQTMRVCHTCNISICEDCSCYARFYRDIKEEGQPDVSINEEFYFCKFHFHEYVKSLTPEVLEDMLKNNFTITGCCEENGRKIFYVRELKGDDVSAIVRYALELWPSDEWKDWNTM